MPRLPFLSLSRLLIITFIGSTSWGLTSCGGEDAADSGAGSGSGLTGDCVVGGQSCRQRCDATLGCVECASDLDCGGGSPACILGRCEECSVSSDCATGQACHPGRFECAAACTGDGDCPGDRNICDTLTGECVGCLDDGDCPAAARYCDTLRAKCAECMSSSHCGGGDPVCDLRDGECVECLLDVDCGPAERCGGDRKCHSACESDLDCGGDKRFCDAPRGECVECILSADCPSSEPVCNDKLKCVECDRDADCGGITPICKGDKCVECDRDEDCLDPLRTKCDKEVCVAG